MENSRGIGRKIAKRRIMMKLTQSQLAKLLGLSENHIASIERGRKKLSIRTLVRIAEVLEIELSELLKE